MAGGDVVTAAPLLPSVGSARLGVGYIIFFTLGAGFLLPWNAFVTAVDYFAFLYPGTPIDRVFSISYMVSGFLLLVVIVLFLPKSSAPIRINTGLTLFTLALLLVPAMDAVYVKGTPGLYGAFDITVAATFLCGVADALVQGGVIGFAGELLERYMHAVVAGTAASGDRYLKPYIIPVPEVTIVARAKDDECLILASDGLWNVMSNEEVICTGLQGMRHCLDLRDHM